MRGKFELDLLRDDSGNAVVVTGATVAVTVEGTGVPAELFDGLTGISGPGNPFTVTGSTIEFFADQDKRYRIDITTTSGFSRTLRYRDVTIDVSDVKNYADSAVATHSAEVDNVHGIDSGDAVESVSGAQAKADAVATLLTTHEASATPHPNLTLDFDGITYPTSLQIGTPTHMDTLTEWAAHAFSSGVTHGCDITDNLDGTVSIGTGYAALRATADPHTPLYTMSVDAQASIALIADSENYVYLDYNAGSPVWQVSASRASFNCLDKCIGYYIYRDGNNLNIIDAREQNVDGNRKSRQLFLKFQKFIHAHGGTALGGSGLALTVTEGEFFYMLESLPHVAFDTSVAGTANENIFTLWYRDGAGGWTSVVESKTIDSNVYDNNTGTPVSLNNNRYGVSWVYLVHDEPTKLHVVMGSINETSQSTAEAASPPSELPGVIGAHGSIIGFVVYEQGETSFANVLSAFTQQFTSSSAANHNSLAGLQGGATGEYYHLTAIEHADVQALGTLSAQNSDDVSITGGTISDITDSSAKATIDAAVLGSDLVTNGSFTGDATGWTLGSGWAYGTDNVVADATAAGTLSQSISVTSGVNYLISFVATCSNTENAHVNVTIGGTTSSYAIRTDTTAQQSYSVMITASSTGAVDLSFAISAITGTGTITFDDISVVSVTQIPATYSWKNASGVVTGERRALSSSSNVSDGNLALHSNTTGFNNSAHGYQSLYSNTTGSANSAHGLQSLYSNTTGFNNSAYGYQSLYSNTTGFNNSANGFQSLYSNTTGSANSAHGINSLYSNTTGSRNSSYGIQSLYSNTTGSNNSAHGYQSGRYAGSGTTPNETSSNSIYYGYLSRSGADGNTNEIVIGINTVGAGSNTATIGNSSTTLQVHHGALRTGIDNTYDLGSAAYRWKEVFAGTGTINTSDAREKTKVVGFTESEIAAAKQMSREIGTYQWLQSIAEKGESARTHIGLTVQRAIEIMEQNNLDPFAYGFICYDEWDEHIVEHKAVDAIEPQEAAYDKDGAEITPAVEGREAVDAFTEVICEAGDRYGFRYDQLNLFIARGIEARLSALEAA